MAIGAKDGEVLHTRSCARRERMEREQMMRFIKPATMLSVRVVEIEAARLAGEPCCLTENKRRASFLPVHELRSRTRCIRVSRRPSSTALKIQHIHRLSPADA